MNSFYTQNELCALGFKKVGKNVLISKKASIYSADKIEIGSNVRIDDFCILSGKITLGSYIHISAYTVLYGETLGITLCDFCNISARVAIYAVSDDYTGLSMTNPMVDEKYKQLKRGAVHIGRHVIVGSGCTILPDVMLNDGCAIGSMSLVNKSCDGFFIYAGIPIRKIKERARDLLSQEKIFLAENNCE